MGLAAYVKRNWANGSGGGTAVNATNLGAMDSQIDALSIAALSGGWLDTTVALTYSSADGHTFVCTTSADLTGVIPVGSRIKLTHSAATKYFIVTAIAAGTITLYGGTDYTLAAGAISAVFFSTAKSPLGFPLNPDKWTEKLSDVTDRNQVSPVYGTWYNLGSLSLAVPIGAWELEWSAHVRGYVNSDSIPTTNAALSTVNNGVSDPELLDGFAINYSANGSYANDKTSGQRKVYVLVAKTTFYLIARITGAGAGPGNSLVFYGSSVRPTVIKAVCAYL